jgi:hypothetical protein
MAVLDFMLLAAANPIVAALKYMVHLNAVGSHSRRGCPANAMVRANHSKLAITIADQVRGSRIPVRTRIPAAAPRAAALPP